MEKKQSSVEWLYERLERMIPRSPLYNGDKIRYLEQAKQMEKEQNIGLLIWMNEISKSEPMRLETDFDDIVEQYYNETYGDGKEAK